MNTSGGMADAEAFWGRICSVVSGVVSKVTYNQWFAMVKPLRFDGTVLELGVCDTFFGDIFYNMCGKLTEETAAELAGHSVEIKFKEGYSVESRPHEEDCEDDSALSLPLAVPAVSPNNSTECLPRYTFENFVVGEENRYAFSAAQTAAKTPGVFNPLYIYGGTGLGKTHLTQSVANFVRKQNPSLVVRYTTCEGFLNAYVDACRNHTHSEFRDFYRNVDLLLVDDVHNLSGKEQLQEEFFNTFNTIYGKGGQIIMTSDKQPSEIKGLEARLVSRFESGVATQITPPSYETRLAILKMKQESHGIKLSQDLLSFIAERVSSHIRALEGALMRLVAFCSATGDKTEISQSMAEGILGDMLDKEVDNRKVSIDNILNVVAEHFDLHVHDITGSKRPKNIAEPRMIAMYLSRSLTDRSLKEIGLSFGGRNHTTVIHACKQVESEIKSDEQLQRTVSLLKRKLHAESR